MYVCMYVRMYVRMYYVGFVYNWDRKNMEQRGVGYDSETNQSSKLGFFSAELLRVSVTFTKGSTEVDAFIALAHDSIVGKDCSFLH